MDFNINTQRLIIRLPSQTDAGKILEFYANNRYYFEHFEAIKPENFFTLNVQKKIISLEQREMLLKKGIRFYIFLKDEPETLIGTVALFGMVHGIFKRANLGYKLDPKYQHLGYATEAIDAMLKECIPFFNLHRIEAYIKVDNQKSINLIERLNFEYEGIAREYAFIEGKFCDMKRYVLLT